MNLCICNKGGLIFLTFYGRRKSQDLQPFKFPILCIVIITNQIRDRLSLRSLLAEAEARDNFLKCFHKQTNDAI